MRARFAGLLVILTMMLCVVRATYAHSAALVADAYTSAAAPTKNFGAKTSLVVQGPPANAVVANAYLEFDLSTLPAGTTGRDVAKATLTLGLGKVSKPGLFDVFRVTAAWTEKGLTGAAAPTLGGSPEVSGVVVAVTDKNTFKTVDVTALVQDWLNGVVANNGIALVPNTAGVAVAFDSKESISTSHVAQLQITLTDVHQSASSMNMFVGDAVGAPTTTGVDNTALGAEALIANTTGSGNTALGASALHTSTTGYSNVAVGGDALYADTTGSGNTALGVGALRTNTVAGNNTAVGLSALYSNTTGSTNTAVGVLALANNTFGYDNTAMGYAALYNNAGIWNTAVGNHVLSNNTGSSNAAVGGDALSANTTGFSNAAFGIGALQLNTLGYRNTALGYFALQNNTEGYSNIGIGWSAGESLTTGSNNIDIGNAGVAAESNTIRIGDPNVHTQAFVAGINDATLGSGDAVYVDPNGQLGVITSSARFKEDIEDMGDSSSGLMKLRPVRFRYKKEVDPSGLKQYGLVAEEVARVNPELVGYDKTGQLHTVRYHFINAMLLNEVQKQARQIELQRQQIAAQASQVADQTRQLEALSARLTQLEALQGHAAAMEISHKTAAGL